MWRATRMVSEKAMHAAATTTVIGSNAASSSINSAVTAAAAAVKCAPLTAITAVGTRREFDPHWPLPLPPPLELQQGSNKLHTVDQAKMMNASATSNIKSSFTKPTLVLDIDETLIHTFGMGPHISMDMEPDEVRSLPLINYHFLLRPHAQEFLKEVSELFEVVFWTAGTASYCNAVLDAIERHVLQLPPSFYNYIELAKEAKRASSSTGDDHYEQQQQNNNNNQNAVAVAGATSHANFYALSRTQTIQKYSYMKYLPLLGRPIKRTLMVDDNVRSFPLHPRHGIKVEPFEPDDHIMQQFIMRLHDQGVLEPVNVLHTDLLASDEHVAKLELERLSSDHALLDLLPILRSVAKIGPDEDVSRELDHWRPIDYVECDNFYETIDRKSVVRQRILGQVVYTRRDEPIPPIKMHYMNSVIVCDVSNAVKYIQTNHFTSKL